VTIIIILCHGYWKDYATKENLGLDGNSYDSYIKSLINTLNKPWFSRAWIAQEAALSVSPIVLSSEGINFRLLHHLLIVVATIKAEATGSLSMKSSQVLRSRGAKAVRRVETCRREATSRSQNSLSFLDILRRLTFSMDATDA
jgi:hypothetical protein